MIDKGLFRLSGNVVPKKENKYRKLKTGQLRIIGQKRYCSTEKAGKLIAILSLIAIISLAIAPAQAAQVHQINSSIHSDSSVQGTSDSSPPQLVGEVSHNGMLIVVWYNDQIGQTHFIKNNQLYRFDSIQISVYNPTHENNLNITVEQYTLGSRTENVTSGNQTYPRTVYTFSNVVYANQTVAISYRGITEGNISLPYTSSLKSVTINANGAVFQFRHLSIPPANQVPFANAPVTMLIFLIIAVGIAYAMASALAAGFVRRVRYWPRISGMGWGVIVFLLLLSGGIFFYTFYYDIPTLPWYSFLLPAFVMFFLGMANLWPQVFKSWSLRSYPHQASKREDSAVTWNRRIFAVPDDTEYNIPGYRYSGYIRVSRLSRKEAILRLFGRKIPILFPEGDEPTKLGNESVDPLDGDNREYILKAGEKGRLIKVKTEVSELENEPKSQPMENTESKKRFRKDKFVKTKKVTAYLIPVSHWHTMDMADFLARSNTESILSNKLENCLVEKTQLEASKELKYLDTTDMGLDILLQQLKARRKKETGEDKNGSVL